MQRILDRTQESLDEAFASLARTADRQRRIYVKTIALLIVIVAVSATLLSVMAISKHLEYVRSIGAQDASSISLLLHRGLSFLKRTELTVKFYQETQDTHRVPDELEAQMRQTGVVALSSTTLHKPFDILIADATRTAWGADLNTRLWRLVEAADSTMATRSSFDLDYRSMLIGISDDFAVLTPALSPAIDPHAPPLQPALINTLRDALVRNLKAQHRITAPARDTYMLIGPYRDPLIDAPVMTAIGAYYADRVPVALIAMTIPVDQFLADMYRSPATGTRVLLSNLGRVVIASPHMSAADAESLKAEAMHVPPGVLRYSLDGVIFSEPVGPGLALLVCHVSWTAVIAALAWQLGAIAGVALLLALAIILTARYWGLRLLRRSNDEARRALESETINHILVSATPVGLCIVRQADFSILTSNQLAKELLHLENASAFPEHVVAAFRQRNLHEPGTSRFAKIAEFYVTALPSDTSLADDPNTEYLQINYAAARYAGEDVLFCAILDVTMRHALGRQLRAAQRETESMMRAQTNFFAAMSHEIRTPLNALLGNLELLSRTPGLDAHRQRLRAVGVAADGLRRIVNDILDFSKIDAGKLKLLIESFKPIDDLEGLALSYAPLAADRPVRFYAHLSPTLYETVRGDRARVVQIVNNLLSNAFKFTSSGKITLNARVDVDPHGRPMLTCRVLDSGIGMDPALVARIFNPFVQAEPSSSSRYGGTGLGLSICSRLCELMGGQIRVDSALGLGSAFTVTIPLEPSGRSTETPPPPYRGNALTLCAEPASVKVLDEMLAYAGWTAHNVSSVTAAEAWLRLNQPAFVIVNGEYDLATTAALRAVQAVSVVWVTRAGPHRPVAHGDGVLEVTEFSQAAFFACVELATGGTPEIDAPADREVGPEAGEADPSLRGLRILVAEDNPLNQALVTEQLTTLGCLPILVGDGRQALATLAHADVDLVLTDVHMPIMDGYALIEELRQTHAHLPVLAFSAVTGAEQVDEWRRRGFANYIPKPASLKQLEAGLLSLGLRAAVEAEEEPLSAHKQAPTSDAHSEPRPAHESSEATPPDTATTLAPADKARFMQMLRDHLSGDLPKLAAIIDSRDQRALREWAHSAAGAFLVVQEPAFAAQCRELQYLCDEEPAWTQDLAAHAIALHDHLRSHFTLDATAP